MKLLVSVFLACVCFAQETITEPEFNDVFFRLEDGKLIALERQTITTQGKASGFIVMNMKAVSRIPGKKSPIRFESGVPLQFVVRSSFAITALDPSTHFGLRKLDVKGDHREGVFMRGHAGPFGESTSTNLQAGVLPVTYKKVGKSSYLISTEPLPKGEYALGLIYPTVLFCFGVDGKKE